MRFNPRARMGRDYVDRDHVAIMQSVSIHAPAGARPDLYSSNDAISTCFNPRARMGRDHVSSISCYRQTWFQSTRPQGARLSSTYTVKHSHEFQSTRPHGARPFNRASLADRSCVSIHAPARGATLH